MKPNFDVRIVNFTLKQEIEGAWQPIDFSSLLESMEVDNTSSMNEGEVREMALMALNDVEPVKAAELVLARHFGDRLNSGQIQNAANEMLEEKLWEEYADISMHEGMFNVASILFQASPSVFPEPDAVKVTLDVSASNQAAQELLDNKVTEPFLVRLLADGMNTNSILHRLFEDQLAGFSFPEADKLAWIWNVGTVDEKTVSIEVTSSGYWLNPLRNTKSYVSSAHFDK